MTSHQLNDAGRFTVGCGRNRTNGETKVKRFVPPPRVSFFITYAVIFCLALIQAATGPGKTGTVFPLMAQSSVPDVQALGILPFRGGSPLLTLG